MTSPLAARLTPSVRTIAAGLLLGSIAAAGPGVCAPADPLALSPSKVYVTTSMSAGPNLTATLTEYFTGEKNEKTAMNLLLGVHVLEDGKMRLVASRDYNAEAGGYVSRGSLAIVDLDNDGAKEMLVTYHHNEAPGTTRIEMDVLRLGGDRLTLVWTGPVRVNTALPGAGIAPSDRDQFLREIDYGRTSASRGRKICFTKTVGVAAGATLDPPRILKEELPLAEK